MRPSLFVLVCSLAACQTPHSQEVTTLNPYEYQLNEGEYGIELLPIKESWPDLSIGWQRREELIDATQKSLNYLAKPSSKNFFPVGPKKEITHDLMTRSVAKFNEVLHKAASSEDFLRAYSPSF